MAKILDPQSPVVVVVFPFRLHAAEPHANPRIQFLERPSTGREQRREVIRGAPDDPIQFLDHSSVEIVVPHR